MAQPPVHRETFIALRARREAHRVASDLLHPPLNPYQFYCKHCGHPLDNQNLDVNDHIRCEACGRRTHLPAGAVAELRRRARRRVRRCGCKCSDMSDVAIWAYLLLAVILLLSSM